MDGVWIASDKYAKERDNYGGMNNTMRTPARPSSAEASSPAKTADSTVGLATPPTTPKASPTSVITSIAETIQSGVANVVNAAQAFSEQSLDQSAVTPVTQTPAVEKGEPMTNTISNHVSSVVDAAHAFASQSLNQSTDSTMDEPTLVEKARPITTQIASGVANVAFAAQVFANQALDTSAVTPLETPAVETEAVVSPVDDDAVAKSKAALATASTTIADVVEKAKPKVEESKETTTTEDVPPAAPAASPKTSTTVSNKQMPILSLGHPIDNTTSSMVPQALPVAGSATAGLSPLGSPSTHAPINLASSRKSSEVNVKPKVEEAKETAVAPEVPPAAPTATPNISTSAFNKQMPILPLGHPIDNTTSSTVPQAFLVAGAATSRSPLGSPSDTHAPIDLASSRKSSQVITPTLAPPVLAADPTPAPAIPTEAPASTEAVTTTAPSELNPPSAPEVLAADSTPAPAVPADTPKGKEELVSHATAPVTPSSSASAVKTSPPTALPPPSNVSSPSISVKNGAPTTPVKNGGPFPAPVEPGTPGSVRSAASSSRFGSTKKRHSFLGKIKDIFHHDKEGKDGSPEKAEKKPKHRRLSSMGTSSS